jgi:hypothetical protein
MSLPYFCLYNWEAEVVTVAETHADLPVDPILAKGIPPQIKIHRVGALNKNITEKLGLGSIALRSLWHLNKAVSLLLEREHFDLVFFSTTQFPVCILGRHWQRKYGIPYVIDMQDPWFSDYYQNKPKNKRPAKYWFSYRLNKYLEPIAMSRVGGLISVSPQYIIDLQKRYRRLNHVVTAVIPFGAFKPDMELAKQMDVVITEIINPTTLNVLYIGRGGQDMETAIKIIFRGLAMAIENVPGLSDQIKLYFIGTSYAPNGRGNQTIMPIARNMGLGKNVIEITDRVGFYHALHLLNHADALIVPGSDDPKYTPSKLYPYLMTDKPLLTLFHPASPAMGVLDEYEAATSYTFATEHVESKVAEFFQAVASGSLRTVVYNENAITKFDAKSLTKLQCDIFNRVINGQS